MRNQDYFQRVLVALKDLKRDHPDIEVCKHFILATDNTSYSLTDKELYYALMKHKSELDMNTLSDEDMEKVIQETDELFTEIDSEDEEDPSWENENY